MIYHELSNYMKNHKIALGKQFAHMRWSPEGCKTLKK